MTPFMEDSGTGKKQLRCADIIVKYKKGGVHRGADRSWEDFWVLSVSLSSACLSHCISSWPGTLPTTTGRENRRKRKRRKEKDKEEKGKWELEVRTGPQTCSTLSASVSGVGLLTSDTTLSLLTFLFSLPVLTSSSHFLFSSSPFPSSSSSFSYSHAQ